MAPDALAQVLRPLGDLFPAARFPELLVGLGELRDDAAVYRINADTALVATIDFFTPIVDDPYQYGAIAATNALSDVYAMGGTPILALNVSCLSRCLPEETIGEILRGGAEKVAEAGAVLAGGHSVDDQEPKYGLVALGFVHPDRVLTKQGAQPGDVLVLTKPLGAGIVTTALKRDLARPADVEAAVASMTLLNRVASEQVHAAGAHACTDVTGFALLGHALEMAERGRVTFRFRADALPFLPGARDYAAQRLFPGGMGRNRKAFADRIRVDESVAPELVELCYTPETSGGLLAALPAAEVGAFLTRCAAADQAAWVVGDVLPVEPGIHIVIAGG